MRLNNRHNKETVSIELIFQSMLGTQVERLEANAKLSRQSLPGRLCMRCQHRGVEVRSKLGSAAARWQRRQQQMQQPAYPSPVHTARADETDWRRRQAGAPFSGLPVGWNDLHNANDLLTGIDYTSGAIGGAQIGAIHYRQSLPHSSRVIPFSKFAQGYQSMGKLRRGLGRSGTPGAVLTTVLDYHALEQGRISETRFIYRTTGTVSSIITGMYVGAMYGGPYGAATGLVVVLAFVGGEIAYDQVSRLVDELTEGIADIERALQQGWIPSF